DPAAAVHTAIQALHKAGQLEEWADLNGSASAKPDMLAAMKQLRERLGPLAASYVRSELHVGGGLLVGQEERNELSFTLHNGAETGL
ncbi:hypothetical protein ABTG83_20080, partial [Acinetobacter baumannii]